ncbi:hypothetical protein [Metabacillus iocasae]|uniref:Uncharacterized protein n=1 Tax=Priestia iocasae TaxID=2291674 RepID=A0ABS2QSW2_9BACI|nr:hypothetical protein [Metabacillus iocasae]MBM7702527.1 hypothetical protein [Metabacillus iocasae]
MGYVLPIQNYQSMQYANRTIGTKHQYHQVEKTLKMSIDSKLKQPTHHSPFHQSSEKPKKKVLPVRNVYGKSKSEEIVVDLTGKGRLINEIV